MRQTITAILLVFCLSSFGQKDMGSDTGLQRQKVVPDSVMVYPDTTVVKVPISMIQTFISVMSDDDYSHKTYIRMVALFTDQLNKQLIKKPKK